MFVKYFELIKNLFDNVFRNNGSEVNFVDYLHILGYTFALIGSLILLLGIFAGAIIIPVFVHKRLLSKSRKKMKELQNCVINKANEALEVCALSKEIAEVEKQIKIRNICFVFGVIFLYAPFIIPTALFIIGKILELF